MLFWRTGSLKTHYFTKAETILWTSSALLIILSFLIFDRSNILNLISSLIGITSLIFNAKGNPIGQIMIVVFSISYGIISYSFAYYGEMITYLGMSAPMALASLISWLKNPFKGRKNEVTISRISKKDIYIIIAVTTLVTAVFFFILKALNTSNLYFSTISVTTSFFAVCLVFKRSPYFALAYALNDLVLIVLWSYASFFDTSYISVVVCFLIFLANDIYGYINWRKMQQRQESEKL